jgi:hypothetical protein
MKVDRRYILQAMSVDAALAPVLSLEFASASDNDSSIAGHWDETHPDGPNVSLAKQIEHNVARVVLLTPCV